MMVMHIYQGRRGVGGRGGGGGNVRLKNTETGQSHIPVKEHILYECLLLSIKIEINRNFKF